VSGTICHLCLGPLKSIFGIPPIFDCVFGGNLGAIPISSNASLALAKLFSRNWIKNSIAGRMN
jgi:orotate phosphoribosyltransferase